MGTNRSKPAYSLAGVISVLGLVALLVGLIVMVLLTDIRYAAWAMLIALTKRVMPMKIEAITVVPVLNTPRLPVSARPTRLKSMIKAVPRSSIPSSSMPQAANRILGSNNVTISPTSRASSPSTATNPERL